MRFLMEMFRPPARGEGLPGLEARLRAHIKHLTVEVGPRRATDEAAMAATVAYIEGQILGFGGALSHQHFQRHARGFANLVFEIPAAVAAPLIIIGAHYDTVADSPGADDNASGVAALIELARHFHAAPPKGAALRFVFFANEEPPYFQTEGMGSLVHARAVAAQGEDVRVMLALEMLGYYSDAPGSQDVPMGLEGLFPETADFIAFVSDLSTGPLMRTITQGWDAEGVEIERLAAPSSLAEAGFSDHWSFWEVGLPAIMVTDTAFFRNPHYHRRTDTLETLDMRRCAATVEGLKGVIRAAAQLK
ncbi:M20/M25/M40 family metallo-hydrolase [Myxococcota bacterium]|nr:M20/M25/M40 family metallo-hydrolase [Myxococcota bacterium]MBU1896284.1 M20/M25/M40 family metallo-hydrolase [Myxococcota bacterium]